MTVINTHCVFDGDAAILELSTPANPVAWIGLET